MPISRVSLSLTTLAVVALIDCAPTTARERPPGPLALELEATAAASREMIPPEAMALIERANRELEDSGIVNDAVQVGDRAPSFRLSDGKGREFALADLLAEGPVVLTFYRGHW